MSARQPTPPPLDQVKPTPPPAPPERHDDLVVRLLAACDGHPHAKIAWPHRILHEAAEEILRLRAELRRIDAVMARRPALDKPTRFENVEHAISTASHADRLRASLAALVGVDGKQELKQLELFLRSAPAPAEDRAVAIDAIHALLATLPKEAEA